MTPFFRNFVAGLAGAATLLLAACGGGGGSGGGGGGGSNATAPVAVATASPATAAIGTAVTLDASSSTGPSGTSLSYQWRLSTRPDGSTSVLSNTTDAKPSFTPDVAGNYVAEVTVSTGQASASARVTVTATTDTPVAVLANPSQTVLLGSPVTLDGSGSIPPTGVAATDLGYQWKLTEQPEGDPAITLGNATSAKATFTASRTGIYKATLVVSHGGKSSAAVVAEVKVNTGNSVPVAKATAPATAVRGTTVVLDGSASTDPDGDTLHYRWSFPGYIANSTYLPKPRASQATIRNANSATAELVPDAVGRYYVDLTVYDNSVSHTQRVFIDVTKPTGTANIAPVAVANTTYGGECEVGGYCAMSGSGSYDADGDALTYKWTYWNTASPGNVQTATGLDAYGISYSASAGTWRVQLVVNDGTVDSAPSDHTVVIRTGANRAPIPSVKADSGTVLVGETIGFDGSASTDRNGDPISYRWTLIDRPDGSNAVLQNANSVKASVVADKPGRYSAYLVVSDPKGAASHSGYPAAYANVFAKAQNNAPVVANFSVGAFEGSTSNLPADQPLVIWNNFWSSDGQLRTGFPAGFGATVFDPDLDNPLYYILTATKYPAGSSFTKSASGQVNSGAQLTITDPAGSFNFKSFLLDRPGEYEFQLLASDGVAYSDTKTVNFSVVTRENYPGILLQSVPSNGDGVLGYPQAMWPVNISHDGMRFTGNYYGTPVNVNTFPYQLYAADRDYTVTDLVASSTDSSVQPYFEGLQNNQVIRKGETVTFNVLRPAIPDENALLNGLVDIYRAHGSDSDEYRNEEARLTKIYEAYRFTWSFRIPEKANRTFRIGPSN